MGVFQSVFENIELDTLFILAITKPVNPGAILTATGTPSF